MNKKQVLSIKKAVIDKMYGVEERPKQMRRDILAQPNIKKIVRAAKKFYTKGVSVFPKLETSKRQQRLLIQKQKEDGREMV